MVRALQQTLSKKRSTWQRPPHAGRLAKIAGCVSMPLGGQPRHLLCSLRRRTLFRRAKQCQADRRTGQRSASTPHRSLRLQHCHCSARWLASAHRGTELLGRYPGNAPRRRRVRIRSLFPDSRVSPNLWRVAGHCKTIAQPPGSCVCISHPSPHSAPQTGTAVARPGSLWALRNGLPTISQS